MSDTIYALATPPGRSGVAVVRISGLKAGAVLERISRGALPRPRFLTRCDFYDPGSGDLLDHGMAVYFQSPHSFTGEDVVELHLHGSRAVLERFWAVLREEPGLRQAEPGEFARRAFVQGKMDLTEAEGLADLIDAQTEAQRRQALRHMDGALRRPVEEWRQALLEALALLEAYIDFPEEDIPETVLAEMEDGVLRLIERLLPHVESPPVGERIREGLRVAIVGAPNVGKSSLLNFLAKRDVAIVSHIAGTTRDVLEVTLDMDGYAVVLADTAGIRETDDWVEKEGVIRAKRVMQEADMVVLMKDATCPEVEVPSVEEGALVVWNKADEADCSRLPVDELHISLKTSMNAELFVRRLRQEVARRMEHGFDPLIVQARHREAFAHTVTALQAARHEPVLELRCEWVRQAASALGRVTGRIGVEEVLGEIFGRFCIGK